MRTPLEIADVVGEGPDVFGVTVVVLDGDADFGLVDAAFDADHVAEQGIFRAVQVFDEFDDAVVVLELVRLAGAFVGNENSRSGRKKCQLLQPLVQDIVAELRVGKNLRIGPEGDFGAGALAFAELLEAAGHGAAGEIHRPDVAFAANLGFEPLGKSVDGRNADAVQAAGARLVTAGAVKLAAGVAARSGPLRGPSGFPYRASSPTGMPRPSSVMVTLPSALMRTMMTLAKPFDGLVDAVIDNFVDQVVQAVRVVSPI